MAEKETLFVSISGGRTSAHMAVRLLEEDRYNLVFQFANTGLEHPKTYDFLHECEQRLGIHIHWLEPIVYPEKGKGIRHKVVDYETADRTGKPFYELTGKYGIPNTSRGFCTSRLKNYVIESHKQSLGFHRYHPTALGIRADERGRIKPYHYEKMNYVFPFADQWPTTKEDVKAFWAAQDFDLGIPDYLGNCVTCWKKSDRKLFRIALEYPEFFEPMARMERDHGHILACDVTTEDPIVFFRGKRSTADMIREAHERRDEVLQDTTRPEQLDLLTPDERVAVLLKMSDLDDEGECGANGCDLSAAPYEEESQNNE